MTGSKTLIGRKTDWIPKLSFVHVMQKSSGVDNQNADHFGVNRLIFGSDKKVKPVGTCLKWATKLNLGDRRDRQIVPLSTTFRKHPTKR